MAVSAPNNSRGIEAAIASALQYVEGLAGGAVNSIKKALPSPQVVASQLNAITARSSSKGPINRFGSASQAVAKGPDHAAIAKHLSSLPPDVAGPVLAQIVQLAAKNEGTV